MTTPAQILAMIRVPREVVRARGQTTTRKRKPVPRSRSPKTTPKGPRTATRQRDALAPHPSNPTKTKERVTPNRATRATVEKVTAMGWSVRSRRRPNQVKRLPTVARNPASVTTVSRETGRTAAIRKEVAVSRKSMARNVRTPIVPSRFNPTASNLVILVILGTLEKNNPTPRVPPAATEVEAENRVRAKAPTNQEMT